MNTLKLTYDGDQHATAVKEPQHRSVAIDCPFTGKGEELSPGATDSRFFRDRGIVAYGMQFDASIESNRLIHGHDERISLKHLLFGTQILYDTLRRFLI